MLIPVLLGVALAQTAAPPAPAEQQPPEGARWAVGAGLALQGPLIYSAQLGVGPNTAAFSPAPLFSTFIERRISKQTWLLGRLEGSFNRTDSGSNPLDPSAGYGESRSTQRRAVANLSVGARHVFNPASAVEVSGYGVLGGGYVSDLSETRSRTNELRIEDNFSEFNYGATLGLILEKQLIENLSLRLATPILVGTAFRGERLRKITSPGGEEVPPYTVFDRRFELQVELNPTLELRFLF